MQQQNKGINWHDVFQGRPAAQAEIHGDAAHAGLYGTVRFYQGAEGVVVMAEVYGLPSGSGHCNLPVFAFHIHDGAFCDGDAEDSFRLAGSHYNPAGCPHPRHAGDMPPLFGAGGRAFLAFLTDRFSARDVIGKTVVIHDGVDDFTTQAAGNAGRKIACGEIIAE